MVGTSASYVGARTIEDAQIIVPVAVGPGIARMHANDPTGDPIDVNASSTMPVEV